MSNFLSLFKINTDTYYTAKNDAIFSNKFRPADGVQKIIDANNKIRTERALVKMQEDAEKANLLRQKSRIENIIKNDKAAPADLNTEQMAQWIMNASKEFNVDPLVISCIAQQETHFTQNVPTKNGSGIMQLTSIVMEDMYQRPQVYDKALLPYLEKYKSPAQLKAAMRKDPELNIKLGAAVYKHKLQLSKGNEIKAFENYNASPIKVKYSKEVYARVLKARQQSGFVSEA